MGHERVVAAMAYRVHGCLSVVHDLCDSWKQAAMSDLHPVTHRNSGIYHLFLAALYIGGAWYHFFASRAHFLEHRRGKV